MTSIAWRDGILASDSLTTLSTEAGGARKFGCRKLYRITRKDGEKVIIATAGESTPSLVFVDWFESGKKKRPSVLIDAEADFTCLVLRESGLFEFDAYCRAEKIELPFYAIGSGAKAALGAMHAGASAEEAVRIACLIDPYSAPPVVTMRLEDV